MDAKGNFGNGSLIADFSVVIKMKILASLVDGEYYNNGHENFSFLVDGEYYSNCPAVSGSQNYVILANLKSYRSML